MAQNTTVQFQIQYHGTKGDENFDLYLFGKKFTFRNIGTSQQTLVRRITGPMSDLRIIFFNAGTGNSQKCWNEDHRRCRRRRRWGKRRTRCTGSSAVQKCSGGAWSRNVIIKSIKLNGSDIKDFMHRSVTSCDPRSGNVTKKFPIENGILNTTGDYYISTDDITANAIGSFVQKPEYDKVVGELDTSDKALQSTSKTLSTLRNKHGDLTSKYNDLLNRLGLAGSTVQKQKGQISTLGKKVNALSATGSTAEEQVKILQGHLLTSEQTRAESGIKLENELTKKYQNIEKENTNLDKENKDRSHTNDTFLKKTYYQQENAQKFNNYNNIMFYIYLFLVFSVIVLFLFKDSKDWEKFKKNIIFTLLFFFIIIIFPFYIYPFQLKIIAFIQYIYSLFSTRVYAGEAY
jgi:hypothetical protein